MVSGKVIRKAAIIAAFVAGPAWADGALTDADFAPVNMDAARLGQLLFYDPILSGNRNISCATCHHPKHATSDGLSLGIGEGGIGLGPDRIIDPTNPPEQRIPRHSPALFNLGAREFTVMFHDGRIEADPTRDSGLRTPMGAEMEAGFDSLLSAQTMFPVLSADEMAGHYSENDVSKAVRTGRITGDGGAWDILSDRVAAIPRYRQMFAVAYPDRADIHFTDISNAIAEFIAFEWRSDSSLYDAYLRSETKLPDRAQQGLEVFDAKCASCHAGPFQTDHGFHAVGQPQFGPGKAARFERHARDDGRMRVTGKLRDAYAFRTPSLRNVMATAPYGHTGAYPDIISFLKAHQGARPAISAYDRSLATLPAMDAQDWRVLDDPDQIAGIAASAVTLPELDAKEIERLVAFLQTLTDQTALDGRLGIPASVPSGLPIDR
ncbi:cytochrome-c peroxidase [Nereida sp. MMG025]|uniref:cytochrome-c peroxidase n=1 Tax=Nereida sp. MMG025 TaxID=2909981 RepID=UPI001F01E217|nr:cytochrome c peroxidase [Nereida sp. MMG025]MCF6444039.1 c-type cytochrome [Nereida sp. MMG025]